MDKKMMTRNLKTITVVALLLSATAFGKAMAYDMTFDKVKSSVDWNKVPIVEKTLFFPGKITYDWLNSEEHRGKSKPHFATKTCTNCHAGEEAGLGKMLIKSDRMSLGKKKGYLKATLQFANDTEYLYIRAVWKTQAPYPGRLHDMVKWTGKKWVTIGGDRARNPYSPMYEDRFTLMIDDGTVEQFSEQGCWMTCHRGMRDNGQAVAADVLALPVIGKGGLKKKDIRKYLPLSRTKSLGLNWNIPKPQKEIDRLKAQGQFVDLMQWRSTRSSPTGTADDGYVFEYRNNDAGKSVFTWNFDRKKGVPKYMFDKSVTGFYALNKEDLTDLGKNIALIEGVNTVPYDESKIQAGQYMQGRLLRKPSGSAGDNSGIASSWADGKYTVVFKRKLNTGHPKDDKIMEIGKTYDFNISIHDGQTTTRFHYVTFPFTVGIGDGASGSIVSTTIK